ncbi:mitochondrial translation elongation factor-like protein G [Aulographum hederae CBS 113979]|uniref:Ribosome-releasing factor 2, mitochondrial n=1 Tax=Aulographum hederae CBS 113979 TaxID=1176131 RepID=A0A6G1HD34_9PEZI|nr:mitochondrial translation elongation factor-like protein G [Aulographum hederae CBS 113979]
MRAVRGWSGPRQRYNAHRRWFSSNHGSSRLQAGVSTAPDLSRTRNIGIIAHIDAGKTTTTERMLYYSGFTRRIGDVDDGSTVTDFLPAERARGITIQSAAISFHWPPKTGDSPPQEQPTDDTTPRSATPHDINLIDTPGHADFTFEVLRSLRILDGAVCILDGVAGVEAQTEKVWTQANHYHIPRLVFVNKLDRDGAGFGKSVADIGLRLHVCPAVCQIPWWKDGKGALVGIGDAINLRALLYAEGSDGKDIKVFSPDDLGAADEAFASEIKKARIALVELLSEHDDDMVEKFLEADEDHLAISSQDIVASLRRCILQSPQRVVPVFAGASFRNIGVQPLLDAVVDLLPSPSERPDPEISLTGHSGGLHQLLHGHLLPAEPEHSPKGSKALAKRAGQSTAVVENLEACALAFKVVIDARRGVLVYVRVYSGSIARNAAMYNTNLGVTERAQKLLKMYASDAVDLSSIDAGQIGVIAGLKFARTGDTLISYAGMSHKAGPPAPLDSLQLRPIVVPPPVFFTSVEPNSLGEEKNVSDTLELLLREDPSLQVSSDPESGQTHLSGMGELHLEIARDRLINDFRAKATIGKVEIGYRELLLGPSTIVTERLDRELAGRIQRAASTSSVTPIRDVSISDLPAIDHERGYRISLSDNNLLTIQHPSLNPDGTSSTSESPSLLPHLPMPLVISSLRDGVSAALARGPYHRYHMHSTHVELLLNPANDISPETTSAALSAAARLATQKALRAVRDTHGCALMEPVMLATIAVSEEDLGTVVHDLSSARGGQVISLDDDEVSGSSASSSDGESPSIDLRRLYIPPDPFAGPVGSGKYSATEYILPRTRQRHVTARVPLKEMVGYLRHLRSITGGRGTFVMQVDRFEKMTKQREKALETEKTGAF